MEKPTNKGQSNNEESEKEEAGPRVPKVTAMEIAQIIDKMHDLLSSCTHVPDAQFKSLDSLCVFCSENAMKSVVQKKKVTLSHCNKCV